MSTTESPDSESLDDIFAKLSQAQSKGTSTEKTVSVQELEEQTKNIPHLEDLPIVSEEDKAKERRRQQEITKIDDPVESVLGGKSAKITDKATLKKMRSDEWFSMPKVELTDELKKELSIIKYRQYLDPKRFYKKDKWQIPEHFQMGTIVGGPTDYFDRMTKKQRGKGFVEELLHDEKSQQFFDRKFGEIQVQKKSGGKKFYRDLVARRREKR